MPRKKPATKAKLISDQAVALADYAAKAFIAADNLQIKAKVVKPFPLDEDERATVAEFPALPANVKKKLAKKEAAFTVIDTATMLVITPMLMEEDFEEWGCQDSTTTMLSDILPRTGKRFRFEYEYDFGDSWHHDILFEGILKADAKAKYPLCLEGAMACPPEDCGGIWGYANLVEAIQDKKHERHEELLNWVGGRFKPEKFDPAKATKAMKKGLPDWRNEAW